eukprot:Tbor_TRINITY_DN3958_c0_g1::TRINITY_DN3958_c0_g1_i1::g.857::m.857
MREEKKSKKEKKRERSLSWPLEEKDKRHKKEKDKKAKHSDKKKEKIRSDIDINSKFGNVVSLGSLPSLPVSISSSSVPFGFGEKYVPVPSSTSNVMNIRNDKTGKDGIIKPSSSGIGGPVTLPTLPSEDLLNGSSKFGDKVDSAALEVIRDELHKEGGSLYCGRTAQRPPPKIDNFFDKAWGRQHTLYPVLVKVNGVKLDLPKDAKHSFVIDEHGDSGLFSGVKNYQSGELMVLDETTGDQLALVNGRQDNPNQILMSAEMLRVTKENRRLHVSGYPMGTTKEDLVATFLLWAENFRREMTQAERNEIQRNTGNEDEEEMELPEDCVFGIDKVIDIFMEQKETKPFAFVELNMEDMCTKFIEGGQDDTVKMVMKTGDKYSLRINRPKDFKLLSSKDKRRLLIQGLPSTLLEDQVKELVGGNPTRFEMKNDIVFVEFADEADAEDVLQFLHGQVIKNQCIVCHYLTDVMRGYITQQKIFRIPPRVKVEEEEQFLLQENKDLLSELVDLVPINQALQQISKEYEHLKPLFCGSTLPVFPTRILVLFNIVDKSDIEDDDAYSKLSDCISKEVEKYGRVKRLIIPRISLPPAQPSAPVLDPLPHKPLSKVRPDGQSAPLTTQEANYEAALQRREAVLAAHAKEVAEFEEKRALWVADQIHPVFGGYESVFVEYENVDEAEYAQREISGKTFFNRTVITSFLFEDILYPPSAEEDAKAAREGELDKILALTADGDEHS